MRLYDESGAPLARYQVFASAVDPDSLAPLDTVLFDMSDGLGTSLEGIFNPLGSARSSPADSTGLVFFQALQLFDAKHGARFKLKFSFKVTAWFEDQMLSNFGATAHEEVSVVSSVTCVAYNPHKLTPVTQPSTAVSLGTTLPQTPSMYYQVQRAPSVALHPPCAKHRRLVPPG